MTTTKPTHGAATHAVATPHLTAPTPEDLAFWDQAAVAALGGATGEVRLTADQVVDRAVSCADRMTKARAAHLESAKPITVTLNPAGDSVAATAETSSFQVTVAGTGTWTAVADAAATWLTVVSPTTPQEVSGTVTFAVAANAGAQRTGAITVNDQTFTVTQSAGV